MAIQVQRKKIKEDLVDENGVVLGYISYNPEDTATYTKLTDIMQDILKISDKTKEFQNIQELPKKRLDNIEEFEKYREDFNKLNEGLHFCDERIENVKRSINSIFGQGVSEIVMEETNDIEMLAPLIEGVLPKFKEAREKKTNKYLKHVETLDVME